MTLGSCCKEVEIVRNAVIATEIARETQTEAKFWAKIAKDLMQEAEKQELSAYIKAYQELRRHRGLIFAQI